MAKSYAEYLKENGARDEDVAILDTPVARKAYDTMQAAIAESDRLRGIAETDRTNYQKWYEEQALPAYNAMQTKVVTSEAELARARAAVLAAQEQGMSEVAKNLGWTKEGNEPAKVDPNPPADTSKYLTRDSLTGMMESVGEGLASLQDMVLEHSTLFPGQRLNVTELRRQAVAAKKNIVQFWEEKYNVPTVRAAADKAAKDAYEEKLRKEGEARIEAKYADQANPELRTLVSSHSPFTQRSDRNRTKQPWEQDDLTNDRVRNATKKLIEAQQKQN